MAYELTYDLEQIAAALAASAAFREWCDDPDDITDHVLFFDGDNLETLPCCVLSLGPSWNRTRELVNGSDPFATTPQVRCQFIKAVEKQSSTSTQLQTLAQEASAIMREVEVYTGWQAASWSPEGVDALSRTKHSAAEDYVSCFLVIDGGLRDSAPEEPET